APRMGRPGRRRRGPPPGERPVPEPRHRRPRPADLRGGPRHTTRGPTPARRPDRPSGPAGVDPRHRRRAPARNHLPRRPLPASNAALLILLTSPMQGVPPMSTLLLFGYVTARHTASGALRRVHIDERGE